MVEVCCAAILLIGIGVYIWNSSLNDKRSQENIVQTNSTKKDIAPGGEKAVLTLADGSTINLDSAANGQLAMQGNVKVIKLSNGELRYQIPGQVLNDKNDRAVFNTMSTPKGGQYKLILPDGTNVWLNAASSITYPTVFAGKEREVKITGEVYFEVAKNEQKPFIVKTHDESIRVLGTEFNVNSYVDEPFIKTSLVEGVVSIANKILHPGEAYRNGIITKTNIEQDVAWKMGFFNFDNTDLGSMLRQISRWYDINIVYSSAIPDLRFEGRVRRDLSLSQMLRLLDNLEVKYKVNGKMLYIE